MIEIDAFALFSCGFGCGALVIASLALLNARFRVVDAELDRERARKERLLHRSKSSPN